MLIASLRPSVVRLPSRTYIECMNPNILTFVSTSRAHRNSTRRIGIQRGILRSVGDEQWRASFKTLKNLAFVRWGEGVPGAVGGDERQAPEYSLEAPGSTGARRVQDGRNPRLRHRFPEGPEWTGTRVRCSGSNSTSDLRSHHAGT